MEIYLGFCSKDHGLAGSNGDETVIAIGGETHGINGCPVCIRELENKSEDEKIAFLLGEKQRELAAMEDHKKNRKAYENSTNLP